MTDHQHTQPIRLWVSTHDNGWEAWVEELETRKDLALDAYIYEKKIDTATYERQCARLTEQMEAKRQQLCVISTPELSDRILEALTRLLANASGN